jgi:hypothetical protein
MKKATVMEQSTQTILLNNGGSLQKNGRIELGAGTIYPISSGPNIAAVLPSGTVWIPTTGSVAIPVGATISIINTATGAQVSTFTASENALLTESGVIISISTGLSIVHISPNGGVVPGPPSPVVPNNCKNTSAGMYIILSQGGFEGAKAVCAKNKMVPANIDIFNFEVASNLLNSCGGLNSKVFVGSYWLNTYGGQCLALWSGSTPGGGAIAVPVTCHANIPILCQAAV